MGGVCVWGGGGGARDAQNRTKQNGTLFTQNTMCVPLEVVNKHCSYTGGWGGGGEATARGRQFHSQ